VKSLALQFDAILCDLDGVVYRGKNELPGAAETLNAIRKLGVKCAFVTNNASRTPAEVADHLRELGISAQQSEIVTSAQAGAQVLSSMVPLGSKIYVVGGNGIDVALREVGLNPERNPADCIAVLQGFGPAIEWRHLAEASYLIQSGAAWVATNSDLTFPTEDGLAPGNGSLVQAVAHAVRREPDGLGGKPAPALITLAIDRLGSHSPLMVGDRYDTDIAGARDLSIETLLVLTGVAIPEDVWRSGIRATYLGESIRTLMDPYPNCIVESHRATCADARAFFDADGIRVTASGGTFINRLRAADALKWELVPSVGLSKFTSGEIALDLGNN
jgi:glycerol 3-phosphatase-2